MWHFKPKGTALPVFFYQGCIEQITQEQVTLHRRPSQLQGVPGRAALNVFFTSSVLNKSHRSVFCCSGDQVGHVAYLEGQPCRKHEHQHKLKVLVNGPQRLDSSVSVVHEEVERGGSQDLVRKQQPVMRWRSRMLLRFPQETACAVHELCKPFHYRLWRSSIIFSRKQWLWLWTVKCVLGQSKAYNIFVSWPWDLKFPLLLLPCLYMNNHSKIDMSKGSYLLSLQVSFAIAALPLRAQSQQKLIWVRVRIFWAMNSKIGDRW